MLFSVNVCLWAWLHDDNNNNNDYMIIILHIFCIYLRSPSSRSAVALCFKCGRHVAGYSQTPATEQKQSTKEEKRQQKREELTEQ